MKKIALTSMLVLLHFLGAAQNKYPSNETFTRLLKKHVTEDGRVNYKGFIKDSTEFNQYLKLLTKTSPGENWTKNEIMAFWINVYNAFTIKLIMDYYPVESIKDIGSKIQIPFVNTPWDIKFIIIGGEKMDLNNVEHGILRKQFNEPLIHMALVCASKSCPVLLNEAYEPEKLMAQMEKQTRAFLSDSFRNNLSSSKPKLNMIFKWYAMDFKKNGEDVISFINRYATKKIPPNVKTDYLDYNWGLNDL